MSLVAGKSWLLVFRRERKGTMCSGKKQLGGGAVAQGLGRRPEEELWEGGGAGGLVGWRRRGSPAAVETQTESVRVDFSSDSAQRLSFQRPECANSYDTHAKG